MTGEMYTTRRIGAVRFCGSDSGQPEDVPDYLAPRVISEAAVSVTTSVTLSESSVLRLYPQPKDPLVLTNRLLRWLMRTFRPEKYRKMVLDSTAAWDRYISELDRS